MAPAPRWRLVLACLATTTLVFLVTIPRGLSRSSQPFLVIAVIAAATIIVALPGRWSRQGAWAVPWPALAFIAWCGLSVTWSAMPRTSLKFTLFTSFLAILALVPATRLPHRVLVRSVTGALVVAVGGSLLYRALDGPRAYRLNDSAVAMFQGIYDNWNILGYTIVLLLPGLLALQIRTWRLRVLRLLALAVAFAVLVHARSATSLIAATLLVAVAVAVRLIGVVQAHQTPTHGRRTWRRIGALSVLLAAVAGAVGSKAVSSLGKDVTTLSGRTELWGAIGTVGAPVPWTGFGWGTVWRYHWLRIPRNERYDEINGLIRWPLAHGHNSLFDIVIQLGAIGAALATVALVVLTYRSVMHVALGVDEIGTWSLLTAIALIVTGITEPIVSTPIGWFLLVLALLVTPHAAPRAGTRRVRTVHYRSRA